MALVTICVPTFNGEKYLDKSLQTIVNQDYDPLEVLIVDDGSSDRTLEIADDYQASYRFIKIIRNKKNLGLVENWNNCINHAQGEWVKFLFQDDLMDHDCISKMYSLAHREKLSLVLSDRDYLFEGGLSDKRMDFYKQLEKLSRYYTEEVVIRPKDIWKLFTTNFLGANFLGEPTNGLIHKSIFEKYGVYDPKLSQIPDFEFWFRVCSNELFGYIPETLNHFRVHLGGASSKNAMGDVSVVDRVFFGLKLSSDPLYAAYRLYLEQTPDVSMEQLLTKSFSHYIRKLGYFKSRRLFGSKFFTYFDYKINNVLKALKSDISHD